MDNGMLVIKCSCGNEKNMSEKEQIKTLGKSVSVATINQFYEKFKCEKCKKKYPSIYDEDNQLLFDGKNLKKCKLCDKYIPYPRLETLPSTDVCSAICINEHNEKISYENAQREYKKEIQYRQEILSIKREKHKSYSELEKRKFTTIDLINQYKSNKINKKKYEIEFKRFTWWIKTIVEKNGGKLIDNPTNHINCPHCRNLSLVMWSPKLKRYFLSCSNFKNGCKWTKTIWTAF